MRFFTLAAALAAACSSVIAHPHSNLQERQSGIVVTTGATGDLQTRYEVRQLLNTKPNQWTLFILALSQWQQQPESSPTSYFGVSAIHGVPRRNYNNVGQCGNCGGTDGYCTHNSVHFPAWHRVYLAHFEQEFLKVARSVANSYPASRRGAMVGAANLLRWPYWDWAAIPPNNLPALPRVITDETMSVDGPNGRQRINNPLFRYDIRDPSQMFYSPLNTWRRTYRWPTNGGSNPVSDNGRAIRAFANVRRNLQDQIYNMFTRCNNYLGFSSDQSGGSSFRCSNNIETIHNTVHSMIGGDPAATQNPGHLTYLPTGSYDPVFWLLHCNVDRVFAMWQVINPDQWGASQTTSAGARTWTIGQGSVQNVDSPLTPFYRDTNRNFWTTRQVRDHRATFRYTYSDFASGSSRDAVIRRVNELYGPNASKVAGQAKRQVEDDSEEEQTNAPADVSASDPFAARNGSTYVYDANIQTPRYALEGAYSIYVFPSKPASEDPSTWVFDPSLIGTMGVPASPGMEGMDTIISGSIPLTTTLKELVRNAGFDLDNLSPTDVVPYLQKNMEWRVAASGGRVVDPSTLKGFSLTVVSSSAQDNGAGNLPEYAEFVPQLAATEGQAGGTNSTEELVGDQLVESVSM